MKVFLCRPRGFCAGVERAIETVERALAKFGRPVYVRHEIVHNRIVVEDLVAKGAIFVDDLADVPAGSHVIFSAHGVAPDVFAQASRHRLHSISHRLKAKCGTNSSGPRCKTSCWILTGRRSRRRQAHIDETAATIADRISSGHFRCSRFMKP